MTVWLSFADLVARGIVANWATLRERIRNRGFPQGVMFGPNSRRWSEAEVEEWTRSRPTAGPAPRGAAKAKVEARAATPGKRGPGRPRKSAQQHIEA